MRIEFFVAAIDNDLYVLEVEADIEGNCPCTIPTLHFGPKLLPLGTNVSITVGGLTEADLDRDMGRYWGYPECCIDHFSALEGPMSDDQRAASQRTGFVPCPDCTRLVLAGKPLHELILPSRQAKKPFRYPAQPRKSV